MSSSNFEARLTEADAYLKLLIDQAKVGMVSHIVSFYVFTVYLLYKVDASGGTVAAAPPPFRPGKPALCASRPLVTSYYCRLGDLLCYIFVSF